MDDGVCNTSLASRLQVHVRKMRVDCDHHFALVALVPLVLDCVERRSLSERSVRASVRPSSAFSRASAFAGAVLVFPVLRREHLLRESIALFAPAVGVRRLRALASKPCSAFVFDAWFVFLENALLCCSVVSAGALLEKMESVPTHVGREARGGKS